MWTILLLITGVGGASLQKRSTNMPIWPNDFKWSMAGVPSNYDCVHINEAAEAGYWRDNYFCWRSGKTSPGFIWNSARAISGMRCTQIREDADRAGTWHDNYLCVPNNSPYDLTWSMTGQIHGKSCIRWNEAADGSHWRDNYLCATYGAGSPVPVIKTDPAFPDDFKWSFAGIPEGYDCIRIHEPSEEHFWGDNYFCWKEGTKDPGMRWSSGGTIAGMRCTRIREPSDPHTWEDNYLCVPLTSPLRFIWSYVGSIEHHSCIQWTEGAEPASRGWRDNFLCFERCQLMTVKIIEAEKYSPTYEGTQVIGSVAGAACLTTPGQEHTLILEQTEEVTEETTLEISATDEINYSVSVSVEVEASAKIFGSGVAVTVGLETTVGGAHSWTRSEATSVGTSSGSSVAHESDYSTPGGAVMFGEMKRYKFDKDDIPATMHFQCPSGGTYSKQTTIKLRSTSYSSADFETLSGRFNQQACQDDYSIVDCVKNLDDQYRHWFGSMDVVRRAFVACFANGRGTVG